MLVAAIFVLGTCRFVPSIIINGLIGAFVTCSCQFFCNQFGKFISVVFFLWLFFYVKKKKMFCSAGKYLYFCCGKNK